MALKLYTGIGSRTITAKELVYITKVSAYLDKEGWTVVSGNSEGADIAFQREVKHLAILPWKGFNYKLFKPVKDWILPEDDVKSFDSVARFHPAPERLSPAAKKLMARNYRQVVGKAGTTKFVIYCADGDTHRKVVGGTSQAIKVALSHKVPCYNIRSVVHTGYPEEYAKFILKEVMQC